MSGSVFGNRIKTTDVERTVESYEVSVLNKFNTEKYHFVKCVPTGSYNRYIKENKVKPEGHGDIDLIIYVKINKGYEDKVTIKDIKKDFKQMLDELPNDVTVPFRDGNNKGKKSQLFGSIVTCTFPILDDIGQSSDNPVQIDNMIVLSEKDYIFQSNFFNMSVQMQSTLQGIFRCILWENYYKYKENNLEQFEYNFSYNKLTARIISYIDNIDWKEDKSNRTIIFESNNWNDYVMKVLEYNCPFFIKYIKEDDINGLIYAIKEHYDERSQKRIYGVINSMIRIGENEKNTSKGNEKEQFMKFVKNTFKI